jgi:VanZ family protein
MSLEILDQHERGARAGVRRLASSLFALPRAYPIRWAIAWTALLLALCLAPNRFMPNEHAVPIQVYFSHTDLAVHFGLFAGFAMSWLRVGRSPLRWVVVPAIGLLLAVGTEYAQGIPFIDRDPNLLDGLADGLGVVVGLVGSAFLGRLSAAPRGTADGR